MRGAVLMAIAVVFSLPSQTSAAGSTETRSLVTSFTIESPDHPAQIDVLAKGVIFPPGTKRIVASYVWKDAKPGYPLGVHWFLGTRPILRQGQPVAGESGHSAWYLSMSRGGALPAGAYQVTLIENDKPGRSIYFTVAAISGAKPQRNPAGFRPPALGGFHRVPARTLRKPVGSKGATQPTTVDVFTARDRDEVLRLTTAGYVWGYGFAPRRDARRGYLLRDPDCGGKFTERWAPDASFSVPDCVFQRH
jgi:hypothetical protein